MNDQMQYIIIFLPILDYSWTWWSEDLVGKQHHLFRLK
jgi:hypothetical protein